MTWRSRVGIGLLLLGACTNSGSPAVESATRLAPSSTAARSSPSRVSQPPLTLLARLSEPAPHWKQAAFVAFGGGKTRLGVIWPPEHTTTPVVPPSFTVAGDGSLWFLDLAKKRLAHYSPRGEYLGEVLGLPFGPHVPHARDLAFWGHRLVVLQERSRAALLTSVSDDLRRLEASSWVRAEGRGLYVLQLYTTAGAPLAWIDGYSDLDLLGNGPRGVAEIDPRVRMLPGAPVRSGAWMDLQVGGAQQMVVTFSSPEIRAEQPLRVRVTGGRPTSARPLTAEVAGTIEGIERDAILVYVRLAPARTTDAERYGSGRWLLRFGNDGSPLVWERLPTPSIDDNLQKRHLAIGPGGRVYLMVPDRRGVHIYVR